MHEEAKYLLGCVIDTVTEELRIPRQGAGSTTWRREDLDRGLEPDACFYLANAERVRGKAIDLSVDPPPDLAIEVDITRSSLDRMGVYAKLGIPEIWRYDGESLRVYLLQADGNYAETETSRSLPFLLPGEVARFLEQAGPMDHSEWGRQFRQWVRDELARASRRGPRARSNLESSRSPKARATPQPRTRRVPHAPPREDVMRRNGIKVALAALGVVALIALVRSVVIVDQTEAVHIIEFGRSVRLIDEPGLHWKWPFQSRQGFDKRLQLDAPPPREMLTKDKKNLEVAWYVSWKIADVERFLRSVRTIPDASARLEDMAASILAAELGGHDLVGLIAVDKTSALDAIGAVPK